MPNPNISTKIAQDFGANASYVETLFERYQSSPSLVDESWSEYFESLIGQISTNGKQSTNGQQVPKAETVVAAATKSISSSPKVVEKPENAEILKGAAKKIVENMEQSLTVPTASSIRMVPVKLLDENRRLINDYRTKQGKPKLSYTHIIAWAIIRAMDDFPQMNDGLVQTTEGVARLKRPDVNFGVAVDVQRKDGTRSLLVPNIKGANRLSFSKFLAAYDDVVTRARNSKLEIADFEGTTVSITNPGTIGTVGSVPRLMSGQAMIIATGAIEYPAEYQAMMPEALSNMGVSKVVQISNTYDHRLIQGAESGAMLAKMHELLVGKSKFYEAIFSDLEIPVRPFHWAIDQNPTMLTSQARERLQMRKQAGVLEMINAYRVRGHLIADLDPLHAVKVSYNPELDLETYGLTIWDLDREFDQGTFANGGTATLRKIIETLRKAYCGTVGVEYRHIQSREEKQWIQQRVEGEPIKIDADTRKQILWKLISAEQFERFLHTNYLGQKRFSIEGSETIIPLLDQLITLAAKDGVDDITFGSAHRGRLNIIANVLGHYCERIFTAFEGSVHPNFPADEGDVKYHQGATGEREIDGRTVKLTLANNPSHLEAVDPVVEGMVRAKQDTMRKDGDNAKSGDGWQKVLPVLIHGDAAFAGQGIVMETLNLAQLPGYRVGGTIHIVVNNQIGFTTDPASGRSTVYSTDIARMTQSPIFHINSDDPDAAYRTLVLALEYRKTYHKDIVLDVIGFRKLGHNESDEPSYTQPLMYSRVKAHPGVRSVYAQKLIAEKIYTEDEVKELIAERVRRYNDAMTRAKELVKSLEPVTVIPEPVMELDGPEAVPTAISKEMVEEITRQISIVPPTFHLNPKMVGQLARRAKMGAGEVHADWAFGEALAFGSLVVEGTHVRLSGQDSGRGTFSQRHAAMYDIESGAQWIPLAHLENAKARFEVFDSSLSEEGVLGFEYGYSVEAKNDLVIWEAQFGDFANGAQTIIDQFISAAEEKWGQRSRLVMLLPHGYEGQGPEHSSARLERFLQLCAENNLQVANPTTPGQYFHLLRRQVKQQRSAPLIIMTPKSLLRLPAAGSAIEDFFDGEHSFLPFISDWDLQNLSTVTRVVLCSGKVYYDLIEARAKNNSNVAIMRVEEICPFPSGTMGDLINDEEFPNLKEIVWCQEEAENMGAWTFVRSRLETLFADKQLTYVGRAASASPATGSYVVHELEQKRIVQEALKS